MTKYKYPYLEQLNRIRRLEKDIRRFEIATDNNFESALDAFTSFFIQCHHLQDWLIKSGYTKNSVDEFIKNSTWLSLCRDLSNKQKHKDIDKYKPKNSFVNNESFGVSTPIARYYDYFKGENRFGIQVWEFRTSVDVIEVSKECMMEWGKFLNLTSDPQASKSL